MGLHGGYARGVGIKWCGSPSRRLESHVCKGFRLVFFTMVWGSSKRVLNDAFIAISNSLDVLSGLGLINSS